MPATLPPELEAKLRVLARKHNRQLITIVAVWFICTFIGLKITKTNRNLGFGIIGASLLVPFAGVALAARMADRQSVALGFTCPHCGKSLYAPPHRFLLTRGECPHCKQPVVAHGTQTLP